MIEAKLEELLAARIASLKLPGVKVLRTFAVAAEGDSANVEEPEDEAVIDLVPENRSQETWEMPVYDFPINLRLRSRMECDKTGAAHFARSSALSELLDSYCGRNGSARAREAFTVPGKFIPRFVSLAGGENETDREGGFRLWSQTITLRGNAN